MREHEDLRLRPHHLLCTQTFIGKGYSPEFTENMSLITEKLRSERDTQVVIADGTDSICEKCPSKCEDGRCEHDDKVQRYDMAVKNLLQVTEDEVYPYGELTDRLRGMLSKDKLFSICGDCEWYRYCCTLISLQQGVPKETIDMVKTIRG